MRVVVVRRTLVVGVIVIVRLGATVQLTLGVRVFAFAAAVVMGMHVRMLVLVLVRMAMRMRMCMVQIAVPVPVLVAVRVLVLVPVRVVVLVAGGVGGLVVRHGGLLRIEEGNVTEVGGRWQEPCQRCGRTWTCLWPRPCECAGLRSTITMFSLPWRTPRSAEIASAKRRTSRTGPLRIVLSRQ